MTTLNSLSQYGSNFQIKTISALLNDKYFLNNVKDSINEEYFDSQSHQWIVSEIIKYHNKYNTVPTVDSIKIELKKIENENLKLSVKEQLKKCYELEDSPDIPSVKEEFTSFCANQKVKKALLQSVDYLNLGDFDSIKHLMSNALRAGEERNVGHEYKKDIETRYREDERNAVPFPWEAFNNITQGGYGKGDLVLIFGNPKGGKSWAIIAMAAEAVKLGFKVVYYALELGESYVGKRFDACLSGVSVDKIDGSHRNKLENLINNLPGELIIKEYSPKRASLSTIENHLNNLRIQEGFVPDVIFIDYLDLLKNKSVRKEVKDDIDDVYVDAKGLAKELGIPIVSPSQANRTGAGKKIIEGSNIAGSYNKIMIGDIVISLARNRKERIEGTGWWHIMGNRYGPDGLTFSSRIDTSTGRMQIDEEPVELDDEEESSSNDRNEISSKDRKRMKEYMFKLENTEE